MNLFIFLSCLVLCLLNPVNVYAQKVEQETWWKIQSIDTMKFSRDIAREKLEDPSYDADIDEHVSRIAATGATHVAVGTPYDEEFVPYLTRWVNAARKYNLNVWFRGNFSGWENWFDYDDITTEDHLRLTENFILKNQGLFVDGDIFTSCPECENGGPGDPRLTGDVDEFVQFLVDSKALSVKTFTSLGKRVETGYFSMNGDVARLIMTEDNTKKLGGVVTIDHYVEYSDQLIEDIEDYIEESGGKVVLGEFGAPIGDIHGNMTQAEQAEWINDALEKVSKIEGVIGINYWTDAGSSTRLWDDNGQARLAAGVIKKYYSSKFVDVVVRNEIGQPLANASLVFDGKTYVTTSGGEARVKYIVDDSLEISDMPLEIRIDNYHDQKMEVGLDEDKTLKVTMIKEEESLWFKIRKLLYKPFLNIWNRD